MPMKAMVYKTLSTVVDDFFAYDVFIVTRDVKDPHVTLSMIGFASRCHSCIAWLVSGTVISPVNR
jgi:hypothetical protein